MKFGRNMLAGAILVLGTLMMPGSALAWNGCAAGIHGGFVNADADLGPLNLGANGQMAGVSLSCDMKAGNLVFGVFGEHNIFAGDIKDTVTVDKEWAGGARAGVLLNQATLAYGLAGFSRTSTSFGNIDGWQVGGGVETKLPDVPLYLGLEYRHTFYDTDDLLPASIDVASDQVTLRLKYKFETPKVPNIFEEPAAEKPAPKKVPLK